MSDLKKFCFTEGKETINWEGIMIRWNKAIRHMKKTFGLGKVRKIIKQKYQRGPFQIVVENNGIYLDKVDEDFQDIDIEYVLFALPLVEFVKAQNNSNLKKDEQTKFQIIFRIIFTIFTFF